jgi:hypothetical protein
VRFLLSALHLVAAASAPTEARISSAGAGAGLWPLEPSGIHPLILLGFLPASERWRRCSDPFATLAQGCRHRACRIVTGVVALAEASPCHIACMPERRRFPPPWSFEDPDPKLQQQCFIVRDGKGQALTYVYFEEEPGGDRPNKYGHNVPRPTI